MKNLPQISGKDLIKFLGHLGYAVVSQKGSHIKLKLVYTNDTHVIIVPNHDPVAKGTLNDILNKVSQRTNKSKKELIELL